MTILSEEVVQTMIDIVKNRTGEDHNLDAIAYQFDTIFASDLKDPGDPGDTDPFLEEEREAHDYGSW